MKERKIGREPNFESPELQKHATTDPVPAEMIVSALRFDVETRQAIVLNRTENLRNVMELAARGVLLPRVP